MVRDKENGQRQGRRSQTRQRVRDKAEGRGLVEGHRQGRGSETRQKDRDIVEGYRQGRGSET